MPARLLPVGILAARYRDFTAVLPQRSTLSPMAKDGGLRRLTVSESRIAGLVAEGLSDEEIADRLQIRVVNVSAELATVLRKLGLESRTELAFLAPDGRNDEGRIDR